MKFERIKNETKRMEEIAKRIEQKERIMKEDPSNRYEDVVIESITAKLAVLNQL